MIEELEDDVSPEVMISLRDLRVSYGDREILHGVSFDVMRGETMVILGGSGSGKSTLLRTLVGLEKPGSGEVILRGKNIATASAQDMDEIRKKLGMSFQGSALFGSMTVGENVALPLREHTKLEAGGAGGFRRLQTIGVERRNEEARSSGTSFGDGSGDFVFRRAIGGT